MQSAPKFHAVTSGHDFKSRISRYSSGDVSQLVDSVTTVVNSCIILNFHQVIIAKYYLTLFKWNSLWHETQQRQKTQPRNLESSKRAFRQLSSNLQQIEITETHKIQRVFWRSLFSENRKCVFRVFKFLLLFFVFSHMFTYIHFRYVVMNNSP